MPHSKVRKYPIWVQVSLCLFGITLYSISFIPDIAQTGIMPSVLRQLGIGVLVFGMTSFAVTHWYSVIMSNQIDSLGEEIKAITVDTFDLIKSAKDSGIARIYPLRTGEVAENPEAERAFYAKIRLEFARSAQTALEANKPITIRMLGISLRAFFNDAVDLYPMTELALKNNRLEFQVLLIDPFSAQAGLRSERESQKKEDEEYTTVEQHFSSTLFQDLQKCTKTLIRYIDKSKRVEARLYSTAPSCMLIFVNESVFVETYHYGRSGVGGLKGGKVPVLEFHSYTSTYKELEGHFEHVWYKSRMRVLDKDLVKEIDDPRTKENIDKLIREFSWLEAPNDLESQSN